MGSFSLARFVGGAGLQGLTEVREAAELQEAPDLRQHRSAEAYLRLADLRLAGLQGAVGLSGRGWRDLMVAGSLGGSSPWGRYGRWRWLGRGTCQPVCLAVSCWSSFRLAIG